MKLPLTFSFERRSKARFIYRLTNRVSCVWALMAPLLILRYGWRHHAKKRRRLDES